MAWPGLPRGDGPFGLGPGFRFLDACCVDRSLALPAVKLPLLIHSSDLRRIAARWLEMMSILRVETNVGRAGPRDDADAIAYAIAAAEAGVAHTVADFAIGTDASNGAEPIVAEFVARRARRRRSRVPAALPRTRACARGASSVSCSSRSPAVRTP